jgi:integrase
MPTKRIPSYRRQKRAGKPTLGFVEVNGVRRYFPGTYDSDESRQGFKRFVAEWEANNCRMPGASLDLRIVELIDRYLPHVQSYYLKNGAPTSEQDLLRRALRVLLDLYGDTRADRFGPIHLEALRGEMLKKGTWSRKTINGMIDRIRRAFRWAASKGLISKTVYPDLCTLDALKKGRTNAREGQDVPPVADATVAQTLPHLAPPVGAMIQVQRLTGARPGEACIMRGCDIDTTKAVWVYTPTSHKTEHHNRKRKVLLGPRAQEIIKPLLKADLTGYLFSPDDAATWHRDRRHAARKTAAGVGNRRGSVRKGAPKRTPGARYSVASYRRAIEHACRLAFPLPDEHAESYRQVLKWLRENPSPKAIRSNKPSVARWRQENMPVDLWQTMKFAADWHAKHSWAPNQLRHAAATSICKEYSLEIASVLLGHISTKTTERYVDKDALGASEKVQAIG